MAICDCNQGRLPCTCWQASGDVDALKEQRPGQRLEVIGDLQLERAALEACGYRVKLKERNGTRWLTACKGLQVQYVHWHPLTNINQAMQLLLDVPKAFYIVASNMQVEVLDVSMSSAVDRIPIVTAADLINAQCRAIVTACASLNGVR